MKRNGNWSVAGSILGILLIIIVAQVPSAHAAVVTYTDRAAFNAAAAGLGTMTTEGYETYPNDVQQGARTITLNNFAISSDLNGAQSGFGITDVVNVFPGSSGLGPTAGSKYLVTTFPDSTIPSGATVTWLLGPGVKAFGSDIKDLEIANMTYALNTGATGVAATPGLDGNVQFFGIISDSPFSSIAIHEPGASTGDAVVFDQTSIVPEPASLCLLVLGGLGLRRRRF